MDPKFILPFDKISSKDLPRVGGKGANLGELTRAGFPVPAGFCVHTAGFGAFLESAPEMEAYYARLARLAPDDLEGVRTLGQSLRAYLSQVALPAQVAEQVLTAWRLQGEDDFYAVRSSATAEDLPTASFAGQQDTFLNVRGAESLLQRVRDCWISLFTDRAILYRAQNGFDHRQVGLSVVVQQMVFPEVSGIAFTADPVSGHRQIVSIDASYGLGEALVAGLVSADLYKVDRRTWQVVEMKVADKTLAIRPSKDGGTYREALGEDLRHTQVLTESQAIELARMAAGIEAHYAAPQDIEWALVGEQFYIVQSRPITALYPLPEQDGASRVYFSLSHAQVMTDVMSPMGISIWKLLLPFGRPRGQIGYNRYIHGVGGRMYIDISPLLNTAIGRRALPNALQVADELSAKALKGLVQREEFLEQAEQATDTATVGGILRWIAPLVPKALHRLWIARPDTAVPFVDNHIRRSVETAKDQLAKAAPGLPRLQTAYEFTAGAFVDNALTLVPFVATIMMAKTLLEHLVRDVAAPADLTAVYSGLEGNVTTMMDLEVGDLADAIRAHPALMELLKTGHPDEIMARLPQFAGGEAFAAQLENFLTRYGMRGPSEIDIARSRWGQDPGSLFQMILGSTGHAQAGAHRDYHRALVEKGWQAGSRIAAAARQGPFGFIKARIVARLVRVFRTHMAVREHPKYMLIQMFALVRRALVEAAQTLVDQGRLAHAEDIWLFEFDEVLRALEQPEMDLYPMVETRRQAQQHYRGLIPPRIFTSEGELIKGQYSLENLPEGAIPGSSVSGGVVEGIARVVTDPREEMLNPGEILVAPFTDPGWTPLFINAAGLVMEVGGLMTHGSVIAREYGIPAVVGVVDATRRIKTGQRIRVQGDAGYVQQLDPES